MSFPYHQSVFSEPFISASQLLLGIRKEWLIFSSADVHSASLTSTQDIHFASAAHSHREHESTWFSASSSVWKFQIPQGVKFHSGAESLTDLNKTDISLKATLNDQTKVT